MQTFDNKMNGLPWVILHNTITLDGSNRGFEADLDVHYRVAASLKAQGYLVGSQTVLEAFPQVPKKQDHDYIPQVNPNDNRPFWVVVDSKGKLKGLLDFFRKLEYIKEIVVLVSENTPEHYIEFLQQREYPYIVSGKDYVDYPEALIKLRQQFGMHRILTDTGTILNNKLMEAGLINSISLIVAPYILVDKGARLFSDLQLKVNQLNLELYETQKLENNYLWLKYHVL